MLKSQCRTARTISLCCMARLSAKQFRKTKVMPKFEIANHLQLNTNNLISWDNLQSRKHMIFSLSYPTIEYCCTFLFAWLISVDLEAHTMGKSHSQASIRIDIYSDSIFIKCSQSLSGRNTTPSQLQSVMREKLLWRNSLYWK